MGGAKKLFTLSKVYDFAVPSRLSRLTEDAHVLTENNLKCWKKKKQFKGKIPHCEIRPPYIFRCRSKQLGNKEKNELNWGQKYVFDYSKRFMGQFNLHFIDFVPSRVKSLVQGWCRKPLVVKLYHSKWVTGATNICWCQPNSTMKFNLPCIENQ